jgi:hypothetical protein
VVKLNAFGSLNAWLLPLLNIRAVALLTWNTPFAFQRIDCDMIMSYHVAGGNGKIFYALAPPFWSPSKNEIAQASCYKHFLYTYEIKML